MENENTWNIGEGRSKLQIGVIGRLLRSTKIVEYSQKDEEIN